jgi:glycosyltransferase involved in cell wall biosynthesis
MKKVLFIAYNFPPKGGPGVQRSVKLVSYLKECGYDPIVLTINKEDNYLFNGLVDETLLESIDKTISIVRTPSGIPYKLTSMFYKLKVYRFFWYFMYPFFWEQSARWPYKTYAKAKEIIEEHDIQLVYTSSGPFSVMQLGYWLQKKTTVKWVADLRDPFTDAYAWRFPSKLHWYFSRAFERRYFSKPDCLIVNTPEVKKLFISRNIVSKDKIEVVTNGY